MFVLSILFVSKSLGIHVLLISAVVENSAFWCFSIVEAFKDVLCEV